MTRTLPRAFSTLVVFTLVFYTSFSQDIKWNTMPQKGFVFQISNKEAQKLLTVSSPDTIFNGLLHTMIDTFDVDKGWIERPEKGHFILVWIVENKLHCEYTSVFPYQVFLLKEYDALALQVLDLDGNVREDAKVKFKMRRLRKDSHSKTYRLENDWIQSGRRTVTVELDGFRSVFNIEKHEVPSWYNDYNNDDGPSFYSYMLTDKSRYKPNEKVRFKSYAVSGARTPLRRDLEVWLINGGKSIKVGEVTPHRPGSFAGEFHLHDSLNLVLDRPYTMQLIEKKGRVVSSCNFKYEDYELNGNKLNIQLATNSQYHPSKNTVAITATDINGLLLKDARATVVVKTKTIRETFQPLVILPDTLLFIEIPLNPDSATVVDIPSVLFQKTNSVYQVYVSVLNSQNQRLQNTVTASHYYSQYELTTRFSYDSIVYEVLNNGIPLTGVPMKLRHNSEAISQNVVLPFKEKLNPLFKSIHLEGNLVSRDFLIRNLIPKLELIGGIEKDSFNVTLNNPQQLEVSWYVYKGSVLLQKGFGKEIEYRSLVSNRAETFYVELLYTFGGEEQLKRAEYEFKDGILNVSLDLPERVFPGQRVEANITVTDQSGNPVAGVDLTAMAVTAKLNHYLPDLPYYGSNSMPRVRKAHYTKNDINKRSAILDLDYKRWEKLARLDTMKYYRFTYPATKLIRHTVAIYDSTQFAPYVMEAGSAKHIYVIEVDRIPVYYSWTDQPRNYSFYVSAERNHEISLRLFDRVIVMDSLSFDACKKTILSLDLNNLPKGVTVHTLHASVSKGKNRKKRALPTFTSTEINRHVKYISLFRNIDGTAYLKSSNQFTPLFHSEFPARKESILVGPVLPGKVMFTRQNGPKLTYQHQGGYTYAFEDNIVYKLDARKLIPEVLHNNFSSPMRTINDLALTKDRLLTFRSPVSKWQTQVIDLVDHASRVTVRLPQEKAASGIAAFLFENSTTGRVVSPCQDRYITKPDFFTIPRGLHNAIVLYNNGTYLKMDSIDLKSYRQTVADLSQSPLNSPDSLSWNWLLIPSRNCYSSVPPVSKNIPMEYLGTPLGNVRGSIYDESNMPLIGANIVVKGTSHGTSVDAEGRFYLDINESRATLVVSFIGYATKEIEVQIGADISVYMLADIQQLSELVVVGYGSTKSMSLTGSVSGRVAGVNISTPEDELIVPDETTQDEAIHEAEQQLYQELVSLNSIRSNFSDIGFWEPRLFTDKRGQSRFTITFPDDITRWEATVYAMNRRLQTGTERKSIKSYKPLMAELHVPPFLTVGDSSFFLGKVLNYTHDKNISGQVKWSGAQSDFEKNVQFSGFYSDKLPVNVNSTDSITTRYIFTRDDGYLDGEERTISVVEQGIIRADGTLSILKNKDEIHVKASKDENVIIEILSSQLHLYAGEVQYLIDYKYACNEQLASKLLGLINHKLLMKYEQRPFRYDKEVNKIIARLLKNQNQEFLWSWWDVSTYTSYWMSAHILRALKAAQDAGYKVDLNIGNIVRKAEYKFEILRQYEINDADLLNALALWNAKLNYAKHIHNVDSIIQRKQTQQFINKQIHRGLTSYSPYNYSLLKDKLLLIEARQLANIPYHLDSLLRYKMDGIMGDIRFSDSRPYNHWYEDELAVNTVAYRIVRRDSLLSEMIVPMQMYFIAARKNERWNTYHSSSILMSVLPDLLADGVSKEHQASITVRGKVNETIEKFPYRLELEPDEEVNIHKDSGLPIYYMQYVEERVTEAKTGVEGFTIKTSFANDKTTLEAGKVVALTVEVDVKKDASLNHVMIEVPIPGACSYADKGQQYNRVETHREYFKERTVIFCEEMKTGKYIFVISLLPRFTGKYVLNPAQVSLMYVPVVNANTNLKAITVID